MLLDTPSPFAARVADHDRKFKRTLQGTYLTLFLIIGVTVIALSPIDTRPEAFLLGLEASLLGAAFGYDHGTRRRQFLRVKGTGPRIGQSSGRADGETTYRSYDVLENPFELKPVYVSGVVYRALRYAPFVSDRGSVLPDAKEGRWLFQTEDSYGRPTFLDASGLIAMADFCKDFFRDEPLEPFLERIAALRAHAQSELTAPKPPAA